MLADDRLSKDACENLLETLEEELGITRKPVMDFLKYLEKSVKAIPSSRGKCKDKNLVGFTLRDANAICNAWDKHANKKAGRKSIAVASAEHRMPGGKAKAGQDNHSKKVLAAKKAWIIQARRDSVQELYDNTEE